MKIIDTHCHIYSSEFGEEKQPAIRRAVDAGVGQILMPAIDNSTHEAMLAIEQSNPGLCLAMMGFHPCSVKANFEEELAIIRDQLELRRFIAIGETGLDFYWDKTYTEQQYQSFRTQIGWALQYDVPVVIHSRNANVECIEVVRGLQDGRLKGVFHCFSGTLEQARAITELGLYLGIGGVLTFKNAGLDKVMEQMPLDRVVLETDAPYLAPVPFRGKRNEPAYIVQVAQKLADIRHQSLESVIGITTLNAQKLFALKDP